MKSEIQNHADFSKVRYANCWEDADILLEALDPQGRHCLSIGSAGDNSFSLLAAGASHVTIAEMNPAQIACIQLRIAAYQTLTHSEFLTLLGEKDASVKERLHLYQKCSPLLDDETRSYWDYFMEDIQVGYGRIGKFENYFRIFREKCLPLVHSKKTILQLLENRSITERELFYQKKWNNWRWRLLFHVFFSRLVMGKLGRAPAFFKYVEGSVADRILLRAKYALTNLNPEKNPYLRWILTGKYGSCLPHALRAENYAKIRENLQKITLCNEPLEAVLETAKSNKQHFQAYNLSDIFEYMSEENTELLLRTIHERSTAGARLAYWNMLAPRSRPESMKYLLKPLDQLSRELFKKDKAFFYSKFITEEVI